MKYEKLRMAFEGREAIYIEKGVLRVRVTNIHCREGDRRIDATVEEIPTPGLSGGLFFAPRSNEPLRWKIGAGYLTTFSDYTWQMGYGGWSLYFAPGVVSGLTNLAADWSVELDAWERYNRALQFLRNCNAYEKAERVFPD